MSVRRRLTFISILLATAILFLHLSGDGSNLLEKWRNRGSGGRTGISGEVISVRTERTLLEETAWETSLVVVTSPNEGPTVMVIGGVHGDEPAGYMAADTIASWAIDRGTLLVLPRANAAAIAGHSRIAPAGSDLNRSFPGNPEGSPTERLAAAIVEIIDEFEPDWVIDLHEAEHFEKKSRGALGQTFIYPYNASSEVLVTALLDAVNRTIILEEYHFMLLRGMARGSAIETAFLTGADSMIVETCKQMPLQERVKFHRQVVSALLDQLNITVY